MARSTPRGTPLSSASPTMKLTSLQSNSRPPQLPSRCTVGQNTLVRTPRNVSLSLIIPVANSVVTVHCRTVVGTNKTLSFDFDSSHDAPVFCQRFPSEFEELHLIVGKHLKNERKKNCKLTKDKKIKSQTHLS